MKRKITLGPYYKSKEEDNWVSDEGVTEGTVRTIANVLCHAVYIPKPTEVRPGELLHIVEWQPYDITQ